MESISYGAGSCRGASAASLIECRSKREYLSFLSYSESQRRSVNQFIPQDNLSGSHMIDEPDSAASDPAMRAFVSRDEMQLWASSVSCREVEGFAESDAASASCNAVLGNGSINFGGDSCSPCSKERERFHNTPLAAAISCRNAFTRTCKLCGTSKTPLWRSGPLGAKSLCNACGIRSKKARRSAVDQHSVSNCMNNQAEGSLDRRSLKRKKFGVARADQEGGWFSKRHRRMLKSRKPEPPAINHMGTFLRNLNAESSCVTSPGTPSPLHDRRPSSVREALMPPRHDHNHRDSMAFARDEEQAAFLLMALSCGLVLA